MAYNILTVAPAGEESIVKIVEDTAINTEENGIVIYASDFSQEGEEYTTTTTAFNFDNTYHP